MDRIYQLRVYDWMIECFGQEISRDPIERADRFVEEALELSQATGWTRDRAHALVDYVFDRPVGEIGQEVGGVAVTLAALCNTFGVSIEDAAQAELARITTPDMVEKIRAKQAAKPVGSALPAHVHPDDLAVDRFAAAMKAKLAKKRAEGRRGWDDTTICSANTLSYLLRNHIEKGDPLDVGNLAMMLHQRGDRITEIR